MQLEVRKLICHERTMKIINKTKAKLGGIVKIIDLKQSPNLVPHRERSSNGDLIFRDPLENDDQKPKCFQLIVARDSRNDLKNKLKFTFLTGLYEKKVKFSLKFLPFIAFQSKFINN
uniref:Uncharacterized protein n=1 Tax=Glossina palpalis gambiensis TaxID=67801 RepID=A0A1B0ASE3_9MUSC